MAIGMVFLNRIPPYHKPEHQVRRMKNQYLREIGLGDIN